MVLEDHSAVVLLLQHWCSGGPIEGPKYPEALSAGAECRKTLGVSDSRLHDSELTRAPQALYHLRYTHDHARLPVALLYRPATATCQLVQTSQAVQENLKLQVEVHKLEPAVIDLWMRTVRRPGRKILITDKCTMTFKKWRDKHEGESLNYPSAGGVDRLLYHRYRCVARVAVYIRSCPQTPRLRKRRPRS